MKPKQEDAKAKWEALLEKGRQYDGPPVSEEEVEQDVTDATSGN